MLLYELALSVARDVQSFVKCAALTISARKELVEGGDIGIGGWTEPREPSVVDEDVYLARLLGELRHLVGAEV